MSVTQTKLPAIEKLKPNLLTNQTYLNNCFKKFKLLLPSESHREESFTSKAAQAAMPQACVSAS